MVEPSMNSFKKFLTSLQSDLIILGVEKRFHLRGTHDFLDENDLTHLKTEFLDQDFYVTYVHFDDKFIGKNN
jgi:hypothetical protein